MNFSQQKAIDTILEERLALLPEEITQLISNTQFKQEVEILIDDLPLEPTQKKELSNFFYMTLLLFVPIDTFIDTLIQKTTIPTDIAQLSYNKLYPSSNNRGAEKRTGKHTSNPPRNLHS